jgi:hypothetical protein
LSTNELKVSHEISPDPELRLLDSLRSALVVMKVRAGP